MECTHRRDFLRQMVSLWTGLDDQQSSMNMSNAFSRHQGTRESRLKLEEDFPLRSASDQLIQSEDEFPEDEIHEELIGYHAALMNGGSDCMRIGLVGVVRSEIAGGEYVTDEKINHTIEAVARDLAFHR